MVHTREHGDGNELGTTTANLGSLLRPLAAGREHGTGTQTMHGQQVRTGERGRTSGSAHLMRDVVELKIQENLEPTFIELANDLRTFGIKERHAHLEPLGVPGQGIGKLEGAGTVAVDGDDNAVAGVRL